MQLLAVGLQLSEQPSILSGSYKNEVEIIVPTGTAHPVGGFLL